ncbi:group II intron reverse transcriptase/maturase [Alkalihalobacillus pseudalcaliphilus]|uniref:group II intron reverse transcriptase/maturase n=1 Tax=Alkalihalobacillus pseudalcaliphilus TaxID=79884 RepID=UPI00064D8DD5|nr:group II intron reverse transcriptase/maturase [Alkalihalobacillus pseudalcaliphilus]KMK74442.1 DNA polymerase [Alkalihalobacillus pseudalcaliphilus]
MLKSVLRRDNLMYALKRVEKNKGSHGVDEMPVQNLRAHIALHWTSIRKELLEGTYQPQPVRRVEIPKANGGKRKLGIPTVLDRLIQQAIAQELTSIYHVTFSRYSFGFRPKRRAHDAVLFAQEYIEEGYRWVVDMDLENFFDKVNHDRLMSKLSERIEDQSLLKLIRKYLQAGVMEGGLVSQSLEGTPQGGPLSPLLSNIVLDELDKELEKRGHRFVRYADDCNIYVKSKRAGERVMNDMTLFIEKKLKLKVNREKSAVDRPWKRKFLGFSFTPHKKPKIRISKEAQKRFKTKVRELTSRKYSIPMEMRIKKLNQFLVGWVNYYQLAETRSVFKGIEEWLRRRLRMIRWKEWKQPRTRVANLKKLKVSKQKAHEWGNSRKGYWRVSKSPILHKTLDNAYWHHQGLKSITERYDNLRQT